MSINVVEKAIYTNLLIIARSFKTKKKKQLSD